MAQQILFTLASRLLRKVKKINIDSDGPPDGLET